MPARGLGLVHLARRLAGVPRGGQQLCPAVALGLRYAAAKRPGRQATPSPPSLAHLSLRLLCTAKPPPDPDRIATVYALSSAPGRAGVAVIRVSGPAASEALTGLTGGTLPRARHAAYRKLRHPQTGDHLDDALVLWFKGPHSYTGEDVVELHVHGGRSVVAAVLGALSDYGLAAAPPGEFTRRAFHSGKLDLTEVEGLSDLLNAETEAQRRLALRQMGGELRRLYQDWADRLLKCTAHCEAVIDFGEDEGLDSDVMEPVKQAVRKLRQEISGHLNDNRRGERLREGVHVAIVGPPNAGKSSLLNFLAQRSAAIVSPIPGTTRDIVETFLDLGGYPVVLADTAGIRQTSDTIEQEGVRRALQRVSTCDVVVQMADASHVTSTSHPPSLPGLELADDVDHILAINKVDLLSDEQLDALRKEVEGSGKRDHLVSVIEGRGLSDLMQALTDAVRDKCEAATTSPTLTQVRHREALRHTADCLDRFLVTSDMALAGEELRLAVRWLGRITGRVRVDDILDVLFGDFCIGK